MHKLSEKIAITYFAACLVVVPFSARAETVDDLNKQISSKQEQIQTIKDKAAIYQKNIRDIHLICIPSDHFLVRSSSFAPEQRYCKDF